jgi:DMSO/TMAO reductase YedYZ molybdopterin-dependent catalytic subunit
MDVRRREFLLGLTGATRLASSDEVGFSDYDADFEVDAQADNPRVRCFDWRRLTKHETPAGEFFIFHKTKTVASVDLNSWRLHIEGCVQKPATFTFGDLGRRQKMEIAATVECSGNSGHSSLMNGLVSHASWRGVALGPILRECGVLPEAREVVFFGMDGETERKWPAREQTMYMPHGRSVFVQDALNTDTLLAFEMNGRPLSAEHGFPIRVILPGWYGMAQVKWLNRMVVLDRRYEGRHMARNYHSIHGLLGTDGHPPQLETSISRMRLKSVVARVTRNDGRYQIHGAAWPGVDKLNKIQVRIDDGPWREAEFGTPPGPSAWSLWSIPWHNATPGEHKIVSRAIDVSGRIQPEPREWRQQFSSSREDNSQWTRRIVLA